MKRAVLALAILSLSGCSLVQGELESVAELNKQYATVAGLEGKLQALEAKQVRLIGDQLTTEQAIMETSEQLVIEKAKLQELVQ